MSYLGCPRIHFMGLFYTNPGNLNNLVSNYDLKNKIDYKTGPYKNPDGVSQWWLQDCIITSVVGPDGVVCADAHVDALVGAQVVSSTPEAPLEEGKGGYADLTKIADLDPSMQLRSEIYGLRIAVRIPGGGGFSGLLQVPQLRDLYFSRGNAGLAGLQAAAGTWHQRLTQVSWQEPANPSPVYDALKQLAGAGLDVKLSVDMYQTQLEKKFTDYDTFGYGRLMAVIGPADAAEPQQLVPGRRFYSSTAFTSTASATNPSAKKDDRSAASFSRERAEPPSNQEPETIAWNPTDFRVQAVNGKSLLLVDMAGTLPLLDGGLGKFALSEPLVFGLDTASGFQPLKNGQVPLDQYLMPGDAPNKLKRCVWPEDSAIVQVELDASEVPLVERTPLAVWLGQKVRLKENPNGIYMNVDRATARMEPEQQQTVPLYVYQFGRPCEKLPPGFSLEAQMLVEASGLKDSEAQPTGDFSFTLDQTGTPAGLFTLTVKTGPAVQPQPLRIPLDSQLYLLGVKSNGFIIGEGNGAASILPLFSLLFWLNHFVVASPTWAADIQPIMERYARLYPGMKGRLDISNEATVKGFAKQLIHHYSVSREDPAFMPVVRDMSPSTVDMMLKWLAT